MIVIVFDRLPAGSLGCYGSFAAETPNFDLLAAQGIVFDQYFIESPSGLTVPVDALRMHLNAGSGHTEMKRFRKRLEAETTATVCCHISFEEQPTAEHEHLDKRLKDHFAHVEACDALLGTLVEICAELNSQRTILVTARIGDPLAIRSEHPAWLASVCEEVTHLPLIVVSDGLCARRHSELIGTRTVDTLLSVQDRDPGRFVAESLTAYRKVSDSQPILLETPLARSIRTSEWLAVLPMFETDSPDVSQVRLFAKPDDRWEQLDLASQYPAVVEDLARQAAWTI